MIEIYGKTQCPFCDKAKALHFTNGGPWFDEYKEGPYAEEWWKVYNSL